MGKHNRSGRAYLTVMLPPAPDDAVHALFIARIGNTFRIELDGELLAERGRPGTRHQDFTKQPQMFRLPRATHGEPGMLTIVLDAQPARSTGLSKILLGPQFGCARHTDRIYDPETHALRLTAARNGPRHPRQNPEKISLPQRGWSMSSSCSNTLINTPTINAAVIAPSNEITAITMALPFPWLADFITTSD